MADGEPWLHESTCRLGHLAARVVVGNIRRGCKADLARPETMLEAD